MFLSDYAFSSYRRSSASIVAASALLVMLGGCGDDGSANNNGTANNNSSPTNNGTQLQPSDCSEYETLATDITNELTLDGCYKAESGVRVSGDGALSIEDGTIIVFAENTGLLVDDGGTLTAKGSADPGILFAGEESDRGYWRGVKFQETDLSDNQLSWVTIDGGGSDNNYGDIAPANLALDDRFGPVKVAVDHTTLRNSGNVGLFADQNTALVDFADNTLTGNATGAARLHPMVVGDLDAASDYSGNDVDVVEIYAGDVKESATWKGINVPYAVADSVSISGEGSDITINGGATFQFAENKGLLIDGGATLTANGASEDPINFEGDESAPGYWRGVKFENTDSSLNQLIWVTIDGGGSDNNYNDIEPANLALDDRFGPVSIGLEHVTFGDEASAIFSDSNVTIAPCTGLSISASDIIGSGAAAAATACGL